MPKYELAFNIAELIARHLKNELNETELLALKAWLSEDEKNGELLEALKNEFGLQSDLLFFKNIDTLKAYKEVTATLINLQG